MQTEKLYYAQQTINKNTLGDLRKILAVDNKMRKSLGKSFSLLAISSAVLLAGCGSGNYKTDSGHSITMDEVRAYKANRQAFPLPYGQGQFTKSYWGELNTDTEYWRTRIEAENKDSSRILSQWTSPQGSKKLDVSLNLHKPKVAPHVYVNVVFTALSLGIIPLLGWARSSSELQLSSDGEKLYQHTASVSGSGTVNILIPWGYIFGHDVKGNDESMEVYQYAQLISHEEGLVKAITIEKPLYEQIKGSKNLKQTQVALNNPRLKFYRPLVLEQLAKIVSQREDRLTLYPSLIQKYAGFTAYIPAKDALYYVGPKDFTVLDIIKKSKQTADKDLLSSLILASGKPYKQFNKNEILWLNEQGLNGATISAMMQAGRTQSAAQPAVPITAGASQAPEAQPQANQPPPNKAAECAKALAAKKACEHAPGPFGIGVNICMKGVKDKFGGYGCPIGF